MTQKYQIKDYTTNKTELFNTEEEALSAITDMEAKLLIKNTNRFSVIQIIESAEGTMWIAPSDNSQEDCKYMVFNSKLGSYETVNSRTNANTRNQELKDAFLAEVSQVPKLIDITQPETTGTQTL